MIEHTAVEATTVTSIPIMPTSTLEMSVYYDSEFKIQISYPKGWEEIEERKFSGADGYLIITKLPIYKSSNIAYVAIDYANTYYAEYDPHVHCIGWGRINGCAIVMSGPDPSGEIIEKIIGVIPYRKTANTTEYFTIETTRQYYIQIGESIIWDEHAFEPTPTNAPTKSPIPIETSFPSGIYIQEVVFSEFKNTYEYEESDEIDMYSHCGIKREYQNKDFRFYTDDHGRIVVKKGEEIIYKYASWSFMAENNPWSFCTWKDDWIIETQDIVIVSGQVLNHKLGFDAVFGWHILNDLPLFFVEKDNHYSIVYNDQVLPIEYDQIFHYLCCAWHSVNPRTNGVETWFHGQRDGVWYLVKISVN